MVSERAERIGGFTLIGFPVFESAVFFLDNYARLELLVRLRDVLPPFLLNPVFMFVCLCFGIVLLDRSYKQQIKRMADRSSALVGVEPYRQGKVRGLVWPFFWMCIGVVLITPLLALAYSLVYKGVPPETAHIQAPRICKTVDCWPNKASNSAHTLNPTIRIRNQGPCSINQAGGVGNTATANCGPPPLKLEYSLRTLASNEPGRFIFDPSKCPVRSQMQFIPNQSVPPPIRIALDFDFPITKIASLVEGVAAAMSGGPFTVGIHAVSVPISSPGIGPHNPLIVEVCSSVVVKMTGEPHLVN
jgi:hypothetical protein